MTKPASLASIRRYAKLMRELGIAELDPSTGRMRFWSPMPPLTKAQAKEAAAASKCPCGHAFAEHTDGQCWAGCAPGKCRPHQTELG